MVVGGSGRVGGSVVKAMQEHGAEVTIGGRSRVKFHEAARRVGGSPSFFEIDKDRPSQLNNFDLVVNTAGPFQGKASTLNALLGEAIDSSVPYVDVCDDYCTSMRARSDYAKVAVEKGVPVILSSGCWPGVSSLMARTLVERMIKEKSLSRSQLSVDFSFFTAGSGNAGVTLLVATFLILAEKALQVRDGRRVSVEPMQEYISVDFGEKIGPRLIAPLNLLETASIADNLGVPNVRSLFGTAPNFWNSLLGLMAKLPRSLLENEDLMFKLSVFSMPVVRLVDKFAGAKNAMRVDVFETSNPTNSMRSVYGHEDLEPCVGECVAAFAALLLRGEVEPGVHFCEEAVVNDDTAELVLSAASINAFTKPT